MSTIHRFPTPPGRTNIGARLNAVIAAKKALRDISEDEDTYKRIKAELMLDTLNAFTIRLVGDVKALEDQLRAFEEATGYKVL